MMYRDGKVAMMGQDNTPAGGKFLRLFLSNEEYAIGLQKVKEIIGLTSITPVSEMPSYIRDSLNLGKIIVPVMDLRLRFGMLQAENTHETCVIEVQKVDLQMGVLGDKVSER